MSYFSECVQVSENFAACQPVTQCTDELNEYCLQFSSICGNSSFLITCIPAIGCDQLVCPKNQTCQESILDGSNRIAFCRSENFVLQFGTSCEDLTCTEGQSCLASEYPTKNFAFAQCAQERDCEQCCYKYCCYHGRCCSML